MLTSFSNQFNTKIVKISEGAVGCIVRAVTSTDFSFDAYLLLSSLYELGLEIGMNCVTFISAYDIFLNDSYSRLTPYKGTILSIIDGAVSCVIYLSYSNYTIVSNCLIQWKAELGLREGGECYFGYSPHNVSIGSV